MGGPEKMREVELMKRKNGRPKTAISLGRSFKNWKMKELREEDCVGRSAVSCERGA